MFYNFYNLYFSCMSIGLFTPVYKNGVDYQINDIYQYAFLGNT